MGIDDGALCIIVIAGLGELHERSGTYLLRPNLIVVRPARYAGTVNAGPEPVRLVTVEYPAAVLRRLGTISLGFGRIPYVPGPLLFRRTFGFSPTEYLLRRRCERARLLLTRDERPVADATSSAPKFAVP